MHIVYFYIRLYSFYGPCGPEIKLYYYYSLRRGGPYKFLYLNHLEARLLGSLQL